jgi:hypothetical protein
MSPDDARLPIRQGLQLRRGVVPSRQQSLTFVTISNPIEAKDLSNRYIVRSRATKGYKARYRQQKSTAQITAPDDKVEAPSSILQRLVHPNPKTILSAGRVDPFPAYPRPLSSHEYRLLDYCKLSFVEHRSYVEESLIGDGSHNRVLSKARPAVL